MSTVKVTNIQNASSASTNIVLDTNGNATVAGMVSPGYSFMRNKIINGAMMIDQRNGGTSISNGTGATDAFGVDRFSVYGNLASKFTSQQNSGSVTPPAGYRNYLGIVSSSAYSVLSGDLFVVRQKIEGYNVADFNYGTANAVTSTLSFWVRSSLTGTFGGSFTNSAGTRSYPFTYSISSANTWEFKTITIPGDTTGTWLTDNGIGLVVYFSMGSGTTYSGTAGSWAGSLYTSATGATSVVGTNAATWYITGVQLEAGTVATPFERRQYGQELALCQRYYLRSTPQNQATFGVGQVSGASTGVIYVSFPVQMRVAPTAIEQSGTASNYKMYTATTTFATCTSVPTHYLSTPFGSTVVFTSSTLSGTAGQATAGSSDGTGYLGWSVEL